MTLSVTRQSTIKDDAFQFMRIEHAFNAFQLPPPNLPIEQKTITVEEILIKYQFILSANEVLAVIEYALNTPLVRIKELEEHTRSRTVKELSEKLTKLVLRYRHQHNIQGITSDDMVLTPTTEEVYVHVYEHDYEHVPGNVDVNVHTEDDIEDVYGPQYGDPEQ